MTFGTAHSVSEPVLPYGVWALSPGGRSLPGQCATAGFGGFPAACFLGVLPGKLAPQPT